MLPTLLQRIDYDSRVKRRGFRRSQTRAVTVDQSLRDSDSLCIPSSTAMALNVLPEAASRRERVRVLDPNGHQR